MLDDKCLFIIDNITQFSGDLRTLGFSKRRVNIYFGISAQKTGMEIDFAEKTETVN